MINEFILVATAVLLIPVLAFVLLLYLSPEVRRCRDHMFAKLTTLPVAKVIMREGLIPKYLASTGNTVGAILLAAEFGFSTGSISTSGIALTFLAFGGAIAMRVFWALGGRLREASIVSAVVLPSSGIVNFVFGSLPLDLGFLGVTLTLPLLFLLIIFALEYASAYEKIGRQLDS